MDPNTGIGLHTGSEMPVLGLGTWELTDDTTGSIEAALEVGYRMFDTAEDYGSQAGLGEGIRRSGIDRESVYLIAKIEENDDAYEATRQNLAELAMEYADLMLVHRPPAIGAGEDLWYGLIRAREEGLARDIGVSNYSTELIDTLIGHTGETPAVNQIEWTPFGHSEDMVRYCSKRGIVIQAYSPLTRTRRLCDNTLQGVASRYGKTPAQVLIRWSLQKGTVPLPKANRLDHQRQNVDVFDFEIDDHDMTLLGGLNEHWSSLGPTLQYI